MSGEQEYEQTTVLQSVGRRFRKEPLVPLGILLTCGALIGATVKYRQGKSMQMNHWLRARVGAQALTIAALLGYAWQNKKTAEQEAEALAAEKAKEDAEFQKRMRAAVEATRLEEEAKANSSAKKRWFNGRFI